VLIREYSDADLHALQRIHQRQALDYVLPDVSHPLFTTRLVLEDQSGRAAMGLFVRLTGEAFLLLDPDQGTPREKWERLLALHQAAQHDARARGLEDVHAWLPPQLEKSFGRRLMQLGWAKQLWPCYSYEL
jgi:hypothetical protein